MQKKKLPYLLHIKHLALAWLHFQVVLTIQLICNDGLSQSYSHSAG